MFRDFFGIYSYPRSILYKSNLLKNKKYILESRNIGVTEPLTSDGYLSISFRLYIKNLSRDVGEFNYKNSMLTYIHTVNQILIHFAFLLQNGRLIN